MNHLIKKRLSHALCQLKVMALILTKQIKLEKIQMQIDGLNVAEASIKRSNHVKPLADLKPGIVVDQRKLNIDPTILFSRLIAIVQT